MTYAPQERAYPRSRLLALDEPDAVDRRTGLLGTKVRAKLLDFEPFDPASSPGMPDLDRLGEDIRRGQDNWRSEHPPMPGEGGFARYAVETISQRPIDRQRYEQEKANIGQSSPVPGIAVSDGATWKVVNADGSDRLPALLREGLTKSRPGGQHMVAADWAPIEPVGIFGSFAHGLQDVPIGAGQLLINALPEAQAVKAAEAAYNDMVRRRNDVYESRRAKAGRTGRDIPRSLGRIVAAFPVGAALIPSAPSLGGALALGALGGAVEGALEPVESSNDFWRQKRQQIAEGSLWGRVEGIVDHGAKRLAKPSQPRVPELLRGR